ncbi:Methyltranfer-dom domain-containing protein [Aphelenchoides bicaudatus]|nr:Methyltranfer-dom domain-containing protein [Aphelenchoides bicaudatus]
MTDEDEREFKSWDKFYDNELANFNESGDEGMVWFGKVAENRMLKFMNGDDVDKTARIVDLGCGNGSLLRKLVANLCSDEVNPNIARRFDVVLDKGTWDAISLGSEDQQQLLDAYCQTVQSLFAVNSVLDQYFVIISCNFTLDELKSKFASSLLRFHKELPAQATFSFGGQTGQTTSGAVFKVLRSS